MAMPQFDQARVLLVDDSGVIRKILKQFLDKMGIGHCVQAECGEDALKHLREDRFDLVLCDWNMPDMTGLDVLKRVRHELGNKTTQFIMITTEIAQDNVQEAQKHSISSFIGKPFAYNIFERQVSKALESPL
jgi:two-component system, chemotaxis family, chemotaxis protein CheY